jgi:hypothetical protein
MENHKIHFILFRKIHLKFAAILPNVCHLYGRTIAGYYENVHEWQTWKMEQKKKKKHLASLSLWKNFGKQLML